MRTIHSNIRCFSENCFVSRIEELPYVARLQIRALFKIGLYISVLYLFLFGETLLLSYDISYNVRLIGAPHIPVRRICRRFVKSLEVVNRFRRVWM